MFDAVSFFLMFLHQIITFPHLLIADIAVLTGMDLLYVVLKTGLTEKLVITLSTGYDVNSLDMFLQLGWLSKLLTAVLTVLSQMDPGDMFLSVLLQVTTVATLVNNVQMLRHPPGLDHLHTELTPSLPVPDDREGQGAASLQGLDGCRDVSLGLLAHLH